MLRSIVVPLDGSAWAEQALGAAGSIAKRTHGEIRLVHVHSPTRAFEPAEVGDEAVEADTAVRAHLEEYLGRLARRLMRETGVDVSFGVAEGAIAPEILSVALEAGADLVVMTSHGHGGPAHAWLGSVADAVIRQSKAPVLVIRPGMGAVPSGAAQFRRILVPLDGTVESEEALEPARALVAVTGAELLLLAVVTLPIQIGEPPVTVCGSAEPAEDYRRASDYLERLAAGVGRAAAVRVLVRESLHPAAAILEVAAEKDIDLVVMAKHGRSRLQRMAMGSVSDKVLRGAAQPVLLVRPQASTWRDVEARLAELAGA